MHNHQQKTEHKSFKNPEEVRNFPNGKAEILTVGGAEVGRLVFKPGWRWSNDVKPLAKTSSCEAPHFQYHVSGKLAIRMDDGTEFVAGPGDITSLPKGHDAWVVGDEAVWSSTGTAPATTPSEARAAVNLKRAILRFSTKESYHGQEICRLQGNSV